MYKQCRTEQSAQRQHALEQGLLKMMQKKHYDQISVSDLCDELEIPRKAFYRYFSGKDGALHALIDHAIMDFDVFSGMDIQNANMEAPKYMEQVFSYWIQNRELLSALARSGLSGVLVQRAVDYTKRMNRLPMLLTNMDRQLRDYGNLFAVCGIMTIIVQWHHDGYVPDEKQMAKMALRLFQEPLYHPQEL